MVEGSYRCSLVRKVEETGFSFCHNGVLKLYWQDEQLKGSMFPTFYWLNSPFRGGTVEGDTFSFTVYFATPCQQFCMDVKGEVDGDQLHAVCMTPSGEYTLTGVRLQA